ncbi:MAG: hypothetical protein AAF558_04000 [Verrucomicrobiota bacterium]
MPPYDTIIELKARLREQFPTAHSGQGNAPTPQVTTGVPVLDEHLLTRGMLVELVDSPMGGGALMLSECLRHVSKRGDYAALIDAIDQWDPQSMALPDLNFLLWVRCTQTSQVLTAADLLLRDGNLPLLWIDFSLCSIRQLRQIPNSVWFRLRALGHQSRVTCIILSPGKLVGCADLSGEIRFSPSIAALNQLRSELLPHVSLHITRKRLYAPRSDMDEEHRLHA